MENIKKIVRKIFIPSKKTLFYLTFIYFLLALGVGFLLSFFNEYIDTNIIILYIIIFFIFFIYIVSNLIYNFIKFIKSEINNDENLIDIPKYIKKLKLKYFKDKKFKEEVNALIISLFDFTFGIYQLSISFDSSSYFYLTSSFIYFFLGILRYYFLISIDIKKVYQNNFMALINLFLTICMAGLIASVANNNFKVGTMINNITIYIYILYTFISLLVSFSVFIKKFKNKEEITPLRSISIINSLYSIFLITTTMIYYFSSDLNNDILISIVIGSIIDIIFFVISISLFILVKRYKKRE